MLNKKKLSNLISFFVNKNNLKISNRFLKTKDEQIIKDFDFEDEQALKKELQLICSSLNNSYITQVCVLDKRQGFKAKDEETSYLIKKVEDSEVFIEKSAIYDFEDSCGVSFDIYTSIFEVLLYLLNQQNFSGCAFHCIEINELFVYMILENGQIKDYGIDKMDAFSIQAKQNANIEHIDYKSENDIYYVILYDRINKFYSSHPDCSFIENIFVYDDLFVPPEIGYLIYTKLLIKTDIVKIDFVQILSDIAISQLNIKGRSLGKKFKDFLSLK